jgi:hypothetical protein
LERGIGIDTENRAHPTTLTLSRSPGAQVDAGMDIVLRVRVSCPDGCDLAGRAVNVIASDGALVANSAFADFVDQGNETTEFAFKAPHEVGDYSWTVVFPKHDLDGLVHEESSAAITVKTLAHDTSLAVWGVPSPIVMGDSFRIHVGATCSAGCVLKGEEIEIDDETGACLARGKLGATPWDGTRALYWTEVDLVAPRKEGATSRSIRFAPTEVRLPHGGASARFGFEAVRPPQYSVTVTVVEKGAGAPVEDAQIRLGVYFAYSDSTGLTRVAVPQGTYCLEVLKTGYEAVSQVVEVNGDLAVDVEVAAIPPESPDAYWLFDPSRRV